MAQHFINSDDENIDSAVVYFKSSFRIARKKLSTFPTIRSVMELEMLYFSVALNDDIEKPDRLKLLMEEKSIINKGIS